MADETLNDIYLDMNIVLKDAVLSSWRFIIMFSHPFASKKQTTRRKFPMATLSSRHDLQVTRLTCSKANLSSDRVRYDGF